MDFKPIRRTWRGVTYDSQLEADWSATLQTWGVAYVYHPGRIALPEGGVWEPDFQVDAGGDDLLLEVKGAHNHRMDKVEAARSAGYNVIVGREPMGPADPEVEVAGAVWEPGLDWFLIRDAGKTVRFHRRDNAMVGHLLGWSADVALEHRFDGVRMFKAVGDEDAR